MRVLTRYCGSKFGIPPTRMLFSVLPTRTDGAPLPASCRLPSYDCRGKPTLRSRSQCRFCTHTQDKGDNLSFIEKVKVCGANVLLDKFYFRQDRFDACLKGLRIAEVKSGFVKGFLKVEPRLENSYRTLHGGAISTVVDVLGTMAILTEEPTKPGVSVEMNTTFARAAQSGEELCVEGRLLKIGKRLAMTQVDIFRRGDGKLIATGRHTKAL